MKITCQSCNKTLNVPDEKIPEGKPFTFKCPSCKSPVTVHREQEKETLESLPAFEGVPDTTPTTNFLEQTQNIPVPPPKEGGALPSLGDSLEDEMEMLAEDSHRALVADSENLERISPVLRKMGYLITAVKSHEEAINKLRFNFYELIIINERFGDCDPNNNPLLKFIEPMTMDVRRRMFVALTGRNFKTLDNMTAFTKSVNMVLNNADFSNFELILRKSMKDNESFYRVFKKMLVETGKEAEA